MNRIRFAGCLLSLLAVASVYPQDVVTRKNKYLLIKLPSYAVVKPGERFDISRKTAGKRIQKIGTARVVKIRGNRCACEIVTENSRSPIRVGDFMESLQSSSDIEMDLMGDDYSGGESLNVRAGSRRDNQALRYLTIVAGAASCGLGYYYNDKANDIYKDYKAAQTAQDASRLYKRTLNYDKNTNLALGVGGGLIALGVIYPFLKPHMTSNSNYSLDVEPVYDGMRVSLSLPIRKN